MQILIYLVQIIHLLLIVFILTAHLSSDLKILRWHYLLASYLLLRWILKIGRCELTEIEYRLRGIKKDEGFIYSILRPIMNITDHQFNYLIYSLVALLGLISYSKYVKLE